jgi:hypothetical protein
MGFIDAWILMLYEAKTLDAKPCGSWGVTVLVNQGKIDP